MAHHGLYGLPIDEGPGSLRESLLNIMSSVDQSIVYPQSLSYRRSRCKNGVYLQSNVHFGRGDGLELEEQMSVHRRSAHKRDDVTKYLYISRC